MNATETTLTVPHAKAVAFLREQAEKGRIFNVRFLKRTTGEVREMLCRAGVKKHLKGGDAAYNFSDKGLMPVYDLLNEGYRSIPLDSLTHVMMQGEWHQVV